MFKVKRSKVDSVLTLKIMCRDYTSSNRNKVTAVKDLLKLLESKERGEISSDTLLAHVLSHLDNPSDPIFKASSMRKSAVKNLFEDCRDLMKVLMAAMNDEVIAEALLLRNQALKEMGSADYQSALISLNGALTKAPGDAVALKNRGKAKYHLNRFRDGLRDLDASLAIEPRDAFALRYRGEVKRVLSTNRYNLECALPDLDASLAIEPEDAWTLKSRGVLKHMMGDDHSALLDLNASLAKAPGDTFALRYRGMTKDGLKDYRGALKDLDACLELGDGDVETLNIRGQVKKKLLDYHGALADFNACLDKNPKNERVLHQRQKLMTDPDVIAFFNASKLAQALREDEKRQSHGRMEEEKKRRPVASSPTSSTLPIIPYESLTFTGQDLGEGGFGVVRQAKWAFTDVAVKQLKVARLTEESLIEFQEEAGRHAQLRHPNVVILYGVSLEPGRFCMVMELMVKGSLYGLLHNTQALPWNIRLSIAKDMVAGLCYLHEQNILHRDIKSLNVLLDDRLRAKLSDFGLSKVKSETMSTHTSQKAVGTLPWMAPELFSRKAVFSQASDVYALGMVLWEIASRERPFKDARAEAIPVFVQAGEREDMPENTPLPISALIRRCWAQRTESRPSSADIAKELMAIDQLDSSSEESTYRHFS